MIFNNSVSSWGRLSSKPHQIIVLNDLKQINKQICNSPLPGIAYGMGRSYGDVCLNPKGTLWFTKELDHFIAFNEQTGRLTCEAGVLLGDIQRLLIPRGWMLPVTPGTQFVTVGGAVANDVHGKNHHVFGTFGEHVLGIKLLRTTGELIECGPTLEPDWFAATVGGLGLTGVIIEAEIQLRRVSSPWFESETLPYNDLDEFLQLAKQSETNWENTVSWIDCLSRTGRGIFMRGNLIDINSLQEPKMHQRQMPFAPPISLVNRFSLRLLNSIYYHIKKLKSGRSLVHYKSFFYPLDNLLEWNRIYGPKGFYQYQSVVPSSIGQDAVHRMMQSIAHAHEGSFLAVLKTFGSRQSVGMLSFPREGITLALDFPNMGNKTLRLFERLDSIVHDAGGRLYPAKDARMPRFLFEAGYPRLNEFIKYRDPGISSAFSRRILGE